MGQSCGIGDGSVYCDGKSQGAFPAVEKPLTSSVRRRTPFQSGELMCQGGNGSHRHAWVDEFVEPSLPAKLETFVVYRRRRAPQQLVQDLATATSSASSMGCRSCGSAAANRETWGYWYRTNAELGRGVSASVFQAQAVSAESRPHPDDEKSAFALDCGVTTGEGMPSLRDSLLAPTVICGRGVTVDAVNPCVLRHRRQVAIKRFKKINSRSFQQELSALRKVAVHPNIIRLYEIYEDCEGEDVLILEYCEGGTLFDVFAKSRRDAKQLDEVFVARIVRQLLLALEHITSCGVEHQDIKPENMMLYDVCMAEQRAQLKLGDFGWAATGASAESLPADGAGSLWYAPPELNPPVESLGGRDGQAYKLNAQRVAGRSDMWSVGVVVYLLLLGNNPFQSALMQSSSEEMEAEVVRLVALGQYDTLSKWEELPQDARDFISSMLKVPAIERMSVHEALRHPYLLRRLRGSQDINVRTSPWRFADTFQCASRIECWTNLDGFQRLSWAAVARAVAEPELRPEVVEAVTRFIRPMPKSTGFGFTDRYPFVSPGITHTAYLWQLASELSAAPIGSWLRDRRIWIEVARLAFRYLDVDGDGLLGAQDLVCHVLGNVTPAAAPVGASMGVFNAGAAAHADAWSAAHMWLARWAQNEDQPAAGSGDRYCGSAGINFEGFRSALMASPSEDNPHSTMEDLDLDLQPAPL